MQKLTEFFNRIGHKLPLRIYSLTSPFGTERPLIIFNAFAKNILAHTRDSLIGREIVIIT